MTNNIVNKKILGKVEKINSNILKKDEFNNYYYDTKKLNSIKKEITKYIQDVLINIDNEKIDEYFIPKRIRKKRFKHIRKGIVCDITLSSIKGSNLFANIGPSIPLKLIFTGEVDSNVKIEIKEYGINNVIMKAYLVLNIKEQVQMPLTSKRKSIKIKEVIAINIIQGEIPNYYLK